MNSKAPKLTIEIEDVGDQRQCIAAIRKLFGAIKDHHGSGAAHDLWFYKNEAPPPDSMDRARLRYACMSFDHDDLRLIFEYYAMAKPNKEKLARDLAKKNESLRELERYPVKSAEDPAGAVLQQIKRAFRFDGEACRIIGEAPEYLRQEKLKEIEDFRLSSLRHRKLRKKLKLRSSLPRIRYITIRQRFDLPGDSWICDSYKNQPGGTK
jgi:hypothetical protein